MEHPLAFNLSPDERQRFTRSKEFQHLINSQLRLLIKGSVDGLITAIAASGAAPDVIETLTRNHTTLPPTLSRNAPTQPLKTNYIAVMPELGAALLGMGEVVCRYAMIDIWAHTSPKHEVLSDCAVLKSIFMSHPRLSAACDEILKSLYPRVEHFCYAPSKDSEQLHRQHSAIGLRYA